MPSVRLRHEHEKFDSLIRRFKRAVEKEGILQEVRDREFYVKPSEKNKRTKDAQKKRAQRNLELERMTPLERARMEKRKELAKKRKMDKRRKTTTAEL